jgi:DNA-binding transcriptional MerR regulator
MSSSPIGLLNVLRLGSLDGSEGRSEGGPMFEPPKQGAASAASPRLPEKKYFKIGEVAALVGVEPHVLRYWETQFTQLRPHKARSGHRLYRRREVEVLLVIKELLHVQRFTIAGAKQALRQPGATQSLAPISTMLARASEGYGQDTLAPGPVDQALDHTFDDEQAVVEADALDSLASGEARVEVEGLAEPELAQAMERQGAGDVRALVEVEVTGVTAPAYGFHSLGPEVRLLEEALAEGRALLSFLDQADAMAAQLGMFPASPGHHGAMAGVGQTDGRRQAGA